MSLESDIVVLRNVPLFSELSDDQLRLLAFGADHRRLRAGETLFRLGARADAGFVIAQGEVMLVRPGKTGEQRSEPFGPGSLIGEMALLTETRRPATAQTLSDCDLIRISRTLFRRMLEEYPEIAVALHERISADLMRLTADILALEERFGS